MRACPAGHRLQRTGGLPGWRTGRSPGWRTGRSPGWRTGRSPGGLLLVVAALAWAAAVALAAQAPADRLSGTVRNEEGGPVPGATVVAENLRASPHLFTATTDEAGAFVFVGMSPGSWRLTASASGYVLAQVKVLLERRQAPKPVDVVMKHGVRLAPKRDDVRPLEGVDVVRLQTALRNADTLAAARQYEQALSAYRDVLRRAPALTLVNLQIGHVLRAQKDYDGAIAAYRRVLADDAENELAMEAIGATELERGRLDAAEEILASAASRAQPGRETLCSLGDVQAARDDLVKAAEWYRRAAAADPRWVRPVLRLAKLAAHGEDRDAAIALFEKAVRMAPGSPEAQEAARALSELRNR